MYQRNLEEEYWKEVPNFPYQVSTLGNVRREGRVNNLKPSKSTKGYLDVKLSKDGIITSFRIHRLVLLTFIGYDDRTVNHKNNIKWDNRLVNLEYMTQKENNHHAIANGFTTKGAKNGRAKLSKEDVNYIRELYSTEYFTIQVISNIYSVSWSTIQKITNNINWREK